MDQLDFIKGEVTIDRQISDTTSEIYDSGGLKSKASYRTIGFPKKLQKLIREHVARYGVGPDGLILMNRLGGPLRYKDAARLFRGAARAHGLRVGEGMHQLRHTCVSILIETGANPKAIQSWVGHSTIQETMDTYGHLFPGSMNQLADKLDEYSEADSSGDTLGIAN